MRYYDVKITGKTTREYTSHPNGTSAPPDPGALQVELDLFAGNFAVPQGGQNIASYVRIWGISIQDIAQASDLNMTDVAVYGGMGVGLPLANPAEAGLLIQGVCQQALGNWIGTEMTLDLFLIAGSSATGGASGAQNITINWKAGTPLAQAIQNTLTTAFPGYTVTTNISPNLVLPSDQVGVFATLPQFATWVEQISQAILSPGALIGPWASEGDVVDNQYPGVQIQLNGKTFNVSDGTTKTTPIAISYTDLIGQPTWVSPGIVQVTCVMRGDLQAGAFVTLPPTRVTTTQAAMTQSSLLRQSSIFQGTFQVKSIRHVGNYKAPDARAWISVLECVSQQAGVVQ